MRVLAVLASAVRTLRVSSRELVGLALSRIDAANDDLNAVVGLREEEALAEAAALDERVARGDDPGALAGVPFTRQEVFTFAVPVVDAVSERGDVTFPDDDPILISIHDVMSPESVEMVSPSESPKFGSWWISWRSA
jgi:amidase